MSQSTDKENKPLQTQPQAKGAWDEFIKTIFYAFFIAIVFRSLFFEPFHIPSGSMKSNLLIGDYLFVNKMSYGYSRYSFPLGIPFFEGRVGSEARPERGDVVVFRLPTNPRIDYIKRVIGLPGDRIQVRSGKLFINGNRVPDEYQDMFNDNDGVENTDKLISRLQETLPEGKKIVILKETDGGYQNNTPVFEVPEKHYFMMGDNRDNSRDSRYQDEVGFVPEENLVGRAAIIFFSASPSAPVYQFWKWPETMRFSRFFNLIS
jgi:signal peptidase I